jgi:DNA-binding NarL/FixJ family response regulator
MATMLDENCVALHSATLHTAATRSAVLLDKHPLLMETVERVLETVAVGTVAKHTSTQAALHAIRQHQPELFILDLGSGEGELDSLAAIREARAIVPTIKSIVLADTSDEQLLGAAFAAGAVAAVFRTAESEDLAMAVRQSFQPSIYLAHDLVAPVDPGALEGPGSDLTKREREILQLVAEGYSNARVARTLWVTEQTVKFHLSNVYRKLDVANRTEASRWAQLHGLLSTEPTPGVQVA